MISVTYDIIGLWYHNQYHMQNHIWYHRIKTMISYFWIYDISNLWYHRSLISYMITSMISPMISKWIPTLAQFCKQMLSMWVYPIAQASEAWQRRGEELGSGEERKAADLSPVTATSRYGVGRSHLLQRAAVGGTIPGQRLFTLFC